MSDKRVEIELNTNLLYMNFTGLSLETMSPDSSTICRFRNSLIKNKLYDELFENVNKQLTDKGLIVETGKDILMDATLTKSNNDTIKYKTKETRSEDKKKLDLENRTLDLLIEEELKKEKPSMKRISKMVKQKVRYSRTFKNKQLDEIQNIDTKIIETSNTIIDKEKKSYNHKERIDKDIRIGYQAGKKQYASGYKNHIITDAISGAILKNKTSFANTADIQALETMVTDIDDVKSFGADKAYKSKEVDEFLKSRNIDNDVCLKERKSMSDKERDEFRENEKPKHKIRAKVERSFALIKTQMQLHSS